MISRARDLSSDWFYLDLPHGIYTNSSISMFMRNFLDLVSGTFLAVAHWSHYAYEDYTLLCVKFARHVSRCAQNPSH